MGWVFSALLKMGQNKQNLSWDCVTPGVIQFANFYKSARDLRVAIAKFALILWDHIWPLLGGMVSWSRHIFYCWEGRVWASIIFDRVMTALIAGAWFFKYIKKTAGLLISLCLRTCFFMAWHVRLFQRGVFSWMFSNESFKCMLSGNGLCKNSRTLLIHLRRFGGRN